MTSVQSNPKPRKVCQLASCTKVLGTCMHCTCDGKCGQHPPGQCGSKREGNGASCKQEHCPKDDTCLHSTRAACMTCRNNVAKYNRSKRPHSASSPSSDLNINTFGSELYSAESLKLLNEIDSLSPSLLNEQLESEFTYLPTLVDDTDSSLNDYSQWSTRRETCNVCVLIHSVQFNLHKFPILLEFPKLKDEVQNQNQDHEVISIINLPDFPGGAYAFEKLCIFAYTGKLDLAPTTCSAIYIAINYLRMSATVRTHFMTYIQDIVDKATATNCHELVHILSELYALESNWRVITDGDPIFKLLHAAIASKSTISVETMWLLLCLPSDAFCNIVDEIVLLQLPNPNAWQLAHARHKLLEIYGQSSTSLRDRATACFELVLNVLTEEQS